MYSLLLFGIIGLVVLGSYEESGASAYGQPELTIALNNYKTNH